MPENPAAWISPDALLDLQDMAQFLNEDAKNALDTLVKMYQKQQVIRSNRGDGISVDVEPAMVHGSRPTKHVNVFVRYPGMRKIRIRVSAVPNTAQPRYLVNIDERNVIVKVYE